MKKTQLLIVLSVVISCFSTTFEVADTTFPNCGGAHTFIEVTGNTAGIQSFLVEIDTAGRGLDSIGFQPIPETGDWIGMYSSYGTRVAYGFTSPGIASDFTIDGNFLKIALYPNCAVSPVVIDPVTIKYETTGDLPADKITITSIDSGVVLCSCGPSISLLLPLPDAEITTPSVTFTWEPDSGTIDSYILQYSTSSAFPDDPSKTREISTTLLSYDASIEVSGDIFWRVKGIYSGGETRWTPYRRIIREFTPESGGNAINWVQIPEDDPELTLGQTYLAKARIFGTNCDITGSWEIDGESIKSFSHSFGPTRSSYLTECVLPTDALGTSTVQVKANDEVIAPPYFSQRDPEWSGDLMTPGDCTLDSRGAVVTCCAMLLNYYGMDTDPGLLNAWLCSNSGYTDCLLYWTKPQEYSATAPGATEPLMTFEGRYGSWSPSVDVSTVSEIAASIDVGEPVLIEVAVGGSYPYHWVLAYSRDGDTYYIHDPYFSDRTTLNSYSNMITGYALYSHDSGLLRPMETSSFTFWGSPFNYNVVSPSNPRPWYFVQWSSTTELYADGESEFTVHGTVYDADFNVVPTDEANVYFAVSGEGIPTTPTSVTTSGGTASVTVRTTTTPGTISIMPSIDCDINPPADALVVESYSTDDMWRSDLDWCERYIERLDGIHGWEHPFAPYFKTTDLKVFLNSIGTYATEEERESLKRLRLALRAVNLTYHHNNYSSSIDYQDTEFPRIEGMETLIDDLADGVTYICIAPVKLWVSIITASSSSAIEIAGKMLKKQIISIIVESIEDLLGQIGSLFPEDSAFRVFWNRLTSVAVKTVKTILNAFWGVLSVSSAIFEGISVAVKEVIMDTYLIEKYVEPSFQARIDMTSGLALSGSTGGTYEAGQVIVGERLASIQYLSNTAHENYEIAASDLGYLMETIFNFDDDIPVGSTIEESFEGAVMEMLRAFRFGRTVEAVAQSASAGDQIMAELFTAIQNAFHNGGLFREIPIEDGIDYYECSVMSYETRSNEIGIARDRYNAIANELQTSLIDSDTLRFSRYLDSLVMFEDTLALSFNYAKAFIDAASPEAIASIPEFQTWYDSLYNLKAGTRTATFSMYWHSSLYLNAFHDDSTSEDSLQAITIADIDSTIYYVTETVSLMQTMLESLFGSEVAPIVYVESYSVADSLWSGDSILVDFVLVNAGAGNAESVTVFIDVETSMSAYPESLFIDHIWERDTIHVQCLLTCNDTTVSDSSALQSRLLAITPATTNGFAQNKFIPLNIYYDPQPLPYRYYINNLSGLGLSWNPDTVRFRGEEKYLMSPDTFWITNISNDTIQIGLNFPTYPGGWELVENVGDSADIYDTTLTDCIYNCYSLRAIFSNTEPDSSDFDIPTNVIHPDITNWMGTGLYGGEFSYLALGDTVHVWLGLDTPLYYSNSFENIEIQIEYRGYGEE